MYDELLFLGVLMTLAFAAGSLGEVLRLPRVATYVIVGILLSESLLGGSIPGAPGGWTDAITAVLLGMIAFLVGSEIDLREVRKDMAQILGISVGQAFGAAAAVAAALAMTKAIAPGMLASELALPTILVLAALAIASGPAALIAVMTEYHARGRLTSMLLPLTAIGDALCIVAFTLALGLTGSGSMMAQIGTAAAEIGVSVALGLMFGALLGLFARHIHRGTLRLPAVMAAIVLNVGLSNQLGYSELLSGIVMGLTSMLVFRGPQKEWVEPMNHIRDTIFLIFFALAGTHFELATFTSALPLILIFVAARLLGKIAGAYAGASIGGASTGIRRWSGFALAPQAGVAIGLALRASASPELQQASELILNVVIGSTIIFELTAPLLARFALARAGEIEEKGSAGDDVPTR